MPSFERVVLKHTEQQSGLSSPESSEVESQLSQERKNVAQEIIQLRAAIENVDDEQLTPAEQSLWKTATAVAEKTIHLAEEFIREHPALTSAIVLGASLASLYLCMKGIQAEGIFVPSHFNAFENSKQFIETSGVTEIGHLGLITGVMLSSLGSLGSLMTLVESGIHSLDVYANRRLKSTHG